MRTPGNRSNAQRRRVVLATTLSAALTATMCAAPAAADEAPLAKPNAGIGYPTFAGSDNPVPGLISDQSIHGRLQKEFEADLENGAGKDTDTDFWMDKMLVRTGTTGGSGETNQYLFSRGRAAYMFTHQPGTLGFAGSLAYWHETGFNSAYTITLNDGEQAITLTEDGAQRKQTPSYWKSVHKNEAAGLTVTQTKFMTNENVLVANLDITGGQAGKTYTIRVASPLISGADGDELTGTFTARNNITTVFPRLSAQGFVVTENNTLTRTYTPEAGQTASFKVQMGLTTIELPESNAEYEKYAAFDPQEAYTEHVTAYNKWWGDNIPYIDTPEDNIDKTLFYRWWLMRFNTLDANVAGNDYQFPTAIEGVLGYNNAIVLTTGMFIDDQKYLRDPSYAYGSWVSAGEVARSGKFVDNPGSPANWSNSYTQYITEAGWRSYLLHGGPSGIAENLARYGENDVTGLIDAYDSNNNYLLEYDWGAMTGNDADAVSFDWAAHNGNKNNNMDRAESAYLYSNAHAAAAAYRVAGNDAKADEMEEFAQNVKTSLMDTLWDEDDKLIKHKQVDRAGASGSLVDWKEINNYYPFSVGLVPKPGDADYKDDYVEALRLWEDSEQYPIFPFYTANQADAAERGSGGSNNFSVINSTVTFRMLSSVLRDYENEYVTADYYKKLLYWNAWAHYINGDNRLPDQNEFWNSAKANTDWGDEQAIGYRSWIHHTMLGTTNFTVIEDVAGLRTREDNKIELDPINIDFDHFMVDNIRYRDKDLTIVWDKVDGTQHYGSEVPEGYSVFLDGELAFTVSDLGRVVYDPATGEIVEKDDNVTVTTVNENSVAAVAAVRFADEDRVVDLFAKAGQDLRTNALDAANLAEGKDVTTSFATSGFTGTGAVDGTTINEPFWGTVGSPNATDSIEIDLGSAQTFDDVRVYFYRTSSSDLPQGGRQAGTRQGYAAPSMYQIEYLDGSTWKTIADQRRTPSSPAGNLNVAEFAPVTGSKIRVTVTHAAGAKTGVKEVQVRNTGLGTPLAENQAPTVQAWVDQSGTSGGTVKLVGQVGDDAKPNATLTARWSVIAPEDATVIFDNPNSASTTARFTESGTYTLALNASDGDQTAQATVHVTVDVGAAGTNVATTATSSTDFVAGWNNINAINDGKGEFYTGGNNSEIWATWPGGSATRWIQYDWDSPVRVNSSSIDFWSDQPAGASEGVAPPTAWKIQYWDGEKFVDVKNTSEYTVERTKTNSVDFEAVTTTRLRATLTASPGAAVGATEWRVFAPAVTSVEAIDVRTSVGELPQLPEQLEVIYDDGARALAGITWAEVSEAQVSADGSFEVVGVVTGTSVRVKATVWVRSTPPGQINTIDPVERTTTVGVSPALPQFVTVQYNDGSREQLTVTWAPISDESLATPGQFEVSGTVEGTGTTTAVATVTVLEGAPEPEVPDTTAPVVSVSVSPQEPESGWFTSQNVTVTATATDDVTAAPTLEYRLDDGDWIEFDGSFGISGEGAHTFQVRATDEAGNSALNEQQTLKIDSIAPVSSASLQEKDRTVTLRAADEGSGVARVEYKTTGGYLPYDSVIKAGQGETRIVYRAIDKAGNVEAEQVIVVPKAGVTLADTALAASGPDQVSAGQSVAIKVSVTSAKGKPTGRVEVRDGNVSLGTAQLSQGKATVTAKGLSVGSRELTVLYPGDKTFAASSDTITVDVVKAVATVKITAKNNQRVGNASATVVVTVPKASSSLAVDGEVTATVGKKMVARAAVRKGKAKLDLGALAMGRQKVVFTFTGSDLVAKASASKTITITKAKPSVKAKVLSKKVTPRTKAKVQVTVQAKGLKVSGKVKVTSGKKTLVKSAKLSRSGKVTVSLPKLKKGTHKVKVTFLGNSKIGSGSKTVTIKVK